MTMNENDPTRLDQPPNLDGNSNRYAIGAAALAVVIALSFFFWPSEYPSSGNETKVQRDTAPTQQVVPPANKPATAPRTPPPQ